MQEKQSLSQEQKLQQRLSPMQVQYVKMLEMNRLEVEEAVRNEIEDNPALEIAEPSPLEEAVTKDDEGQEFTESADDMQRADYRDEDDIPYYRTNINNSSSDDEHHEAIAISETSLIDYLEEQLGERDLDEHSLLIAKYIIGNIDDNGYLLRSAIAISDDIAFQTGLDVSSAQVNDVLQTVRDLDPPGVGATDLRDCLLLQLERREGSPANLLAYKIIDRHFDAFIKRHYDKIAQAMGLSQEQMTAAVDEIRSLNPKPGSVVAGSVAETLSQQVMPDFNVDVDGDEITVTLLNNLPELQIEESFSALNDNYQRSKPANRNDEAAAAFVKQKYDSAANFIKILRQRQETLFNVFSAIVRRQREFFLSGDETTMRPMLLKDIGEDTGYDLSVISRATSGKYVMTQWGIFPLKYFFNEAMQHSNGEEVSSHEVLSIIKSVIADEDKTKPMSDEQLCLILKQHGYEIARRTVAKYRERLGIPVARLRKSY